MIVAPERETPGISASAWAKPMTIASRRVSVVEVALAARDLLGDEQQQAEHDERRADEVQRARAGLDLVGEREPEDADRDRADDEVPADARVELLAARRVAQRREPGARDPQQVAAEVQDDRGHRAELDDGRERGARVLPAEEGRDDPQVAAARDRQELGQALDDAQDDGLEEVHV